MIYKNVRVKLQREDSYQCLLMVIWSTLIKLLYICTHIYV
jgi:hypothetical protein